MTIMFYFVIFKQDGENYIIASPRCAAKKLNSLTKQLCDTNLRPASW